MGIPLRVLIVEDSEDDTLLLVRELQREGYDVTFERVETATTMTEVLYNRQWDIVLADYGMPHFSGTAALELLRENGLDIPFIFVSGTIGEEIAVKAMKNGANDYLVKGNLKRLIPAIERELREVVVRRERRMAEAALLMSEQRYKRLIESAINYIYTVEIEKGKPVSTKHGHGCVAVTGYTSEEYDADPHLWYRMTHEGDKEAVIGHANKVLSGKAIKPLEHRIIHKDGSVRWVRNTPVHRVDEWDNLVAYDGLIQDITERKKVEDQLLQSQKMESIGTLAGGIAHDFNNILTAIIGYGHFLLMKMDKDASLRTYVDSILTSAERAANLTQSLLAFSRKQISNPEPVNLNEIIRKGNKFLSRVIGEDIELKMTFSENGLTVMADAGQIEQVLMNLATNARDAMPKGGVLTIQTEPVEFDSEFVKALGYGEVGRYACIIISDTGIGMNEATKEKIFEPFFTTKEVGKGTGLGLSMVYGIIKQHNGYINCYSESGKGTTFKIYIPLFESMPASKTVTEGAAAAVPTHGTETILLAEDEESVRKLMKAVLEADGYKVIEAADGEEAVNKFMENKDRIDLLLLDIVMPKMNGREVYERIKKVKPDIKLLMASGYPADFISQKGIIEEGLNFIAKPMSPLKLLKKVRDALDK